MNKVVNKLMNYGSKRNGSLFFCVSFDGLTKIEEYEKSVKNGSRFRKEQQGISERCTEVLDGIVRHAAFDR